MLQEHLQKIANITLKSTPGQATELLGTKLVNSEKKTDQEDMREEPTANQIEDDQGKRYQEMPKVDVQMVHKEKIPPGMMKQILVHANLGHKGIGLITPATGGDLHCIHPKTISLMTERLLQETEEGPITEKQRKKNGNGRHYGTYAAYNASHETIILPKNKLVER